jgi:hypothetical protein
MQLESQGNAVLPVWQVREAGLPVDCFSFLQEGPFRIAAGERKAGKEARLPRVHHYQQLDKYCDWVWQEKTEVLL